MLIELSPGGSDTSVTREFDLVDRRFIPAEEGGFVRLFFFGSSDRESVAKIQKLKAESSGLSDVQLRLAASKAKQLLPFIALTAVAGS